MLNGRNRSRWKDAPDGHPGTGHSWKFDRAAEPLVSLGIIVLEADLEFDGLEEVSLLRFDGIFKELLDVRAHSGDSDL